MRRNDSDVLSRFFAASNHIFLRDDVSPPVSLTMKRADALQQIYRQYIRFINDASVSSCKHDSGFTEEYRQIRANDESVSIVRTCNRCGKMIKY